MGNRHLSPWQLLETQTGVYFPYGPGKTTGSAKAVSILSLWGTAILSSPGGTSLFSVEARDGWCRVRKGP